MMGEVDPNLGGTSGASSPEEGDCPKMLSMLKLDDNFLVSDLAIVMMIFYCLMLISY